MRHAAYRRAVTEGEITPPVHAHLAACPVCADFAERVQAVVAAAPDLDPEAAPPGLADRVIERIRSGAAGEVPPPTTLPPRRWPRPRLAAVSAAAALLVVVAAVAALPGRGQRPPQREGDVAQANLPTLLLTSAERTARRDTYRLRVAVAATTDVSLPTVVHPQTPMPSIPSVPDSPALDRLPPDQRAAVEERLREFRRQLEAASPQDRQPGLAGIPDRLTLAVNFEGTGEVVQPDRLHLTGTAQVSGTPPFTPADRGPTPVEVIVVSRDAYLRNPDGTWAKLPGPPGPFSPILLDAHAALSALRHPDGPIENLDLEDLDGEQVRHLRFAVEGSRLGRAGARLTVEAWTGAQDDLLRKLTISTTGSFGPAEVPGAAPPAGLSVAWSTSTTYRLSDFGADLAIEPPPADTIRPGQPLSDLSVLVYPFHTSLSFSSGNK